MAQFVSASNLRTPAEKRAAEATLQSRSGYSTYLEFRVLGEVPRRQQDGLEGDMKKRGLRSPDEGDALALTFALRVHDPKRARGPLCPSRAQATAKE